MGCLKFRIDNISTFGSNLCTMIRLLLFLLLANVAVGQVPPLICTEIPLPQPAHRGPVVQSSMTIRVYYEFSYSLFVYNGSNIATATAYANTLVAQVQTIYQIAGIVICPTIKIWTTPDNYATGTGGNLTLILNNFGSAMIALNPLSDENQLVTFDGSGGISYIGSLCNSNVGARTSVCGIGGVETVNVYPVYSYAVYCSIHELTHSFSSNHTQDCCWTLGGIPNQAIDNCAQAAGYTGGDCGSIGCPPAPYPPNTPDGLGTIMSYCHLNVGINLANGFGPIIQQVITDYISTSPCLTGCSAITIHSACGQ